MRKSTPALLVMALAATVLLAALADAAGGRETAGDAIMRDQVARWGLTDLALYTEARYTRHPSQADRHAAFQDHPGALEHFPTGALLAPPAHLRESP